MCYMFFNVLKIVTPAHHKMAQRWTRGPLTTSTLRRLPLHLRAVGRCRCVSIIAGPGVTHKLARHMTVDRCVFPLMIYDRYLMLLRWGSAAACWRSAWGAQAPKTHATISLFHMCLESFCHEGRYFSPVTTQCCLQLSTHPHFHIWRLFVHCCGMFDVFLSRSPLNCSRSTSLDSSFFCSGERLFLSVRRRNHFGGVDRRETGLCPGKKGRVVLRGDVVNDDSGSCAVFTEPGSSASQMTAAKVMDVIARLPDCGGQAADAISA